MSTEPIILNTAEKPPRPARGSGWGGVQGMSKYDPSYQRPMLTIVCECGSARKIRRSSARHITRCAPCAMKAGLAKSASARASLPATRAANDAWSIYRCNARVKGLSFSLSKDQFLRLREMPCNYCGSLAPNGLDRRDSDGGYVMENVVPCCSECNYGKRDMTEAEFLEWVVRVYEHQSRLQRD